MSACVVVVGSINLETTLQVDGFPLDYFPVRYPFHGISSRVSGVGYNLAKALQTLSRGSDGPSEAGLLPVRFATLVASDPPGLLIQQTLAESGLDSPAVIRCLEHSPQSVVLYDPQGRRQIHTDLKDLQTQTYPPEVFEGLLDGCRLAIITNINYARPLLALARARGVPVACDVQAIRSLDDEYNQDFMKSADILFMSHEQIPSSPQQWASQVQARFGTPLVVIGLGSQGALLLDRKQGQMAHVPAAASRPVVSTVGAGDALLASFVHAYGLGQDPLTALRKAVVFAGHKIGERAASQGFLDHAALELLYQRHAPPAYLLLPDAPQIPGLAFRFAGGPQDAPALWAIHQTRIQSDRLEPGSLTQSPPTLANLQSLLAAVETSPHTNHRLLAEIDGQTVAYTNLESWQEADETWVYLNLGWVLPEWRGRGLGRALLRFGEDRSRRLAEAEHPHQKAEFAANASSLELEAQSLLLAQGYSPVYTVLEMGLDPAAELILPPLPAGFVLQPVSPDQFAQIAESVRDSYQDEYPDGHFGSRFDLQAYVLDLSSTEHDRRLWQVAWDGERVAGQVLSLLSGPGQAEVFEVSVRPAYRRRGLARALLLLALQALRERGAVDIRLCTVAEFRTRACDLYTSAGFRVLHQNIRYRKPF